METADLLYCHNCTKYGHDSSICPDYRWSQQFLDTASRGTKALSDHKIKKESKTKDVIISKGLDDIPSGSILYRFGSFETSLHDGQILNKELKHDLCFKGDKFLEDQFPPLFMHELMEIVPFDLIIYRSQQKLFIRTRGFTGVVGHIQKIIIYWLKLSLEDKRSLKVCVNIPRDVEKLLNVFYIKWEEMLQTTDNPQALANGIKSLQSTLTKISDPSIIQTTTDRILSLRTKLLNLYNTKVTQLPELIRQITVRVKKSLRKKPRSFVFTDKVYLRCVHIYNEIYLPRTLTNIEMQKLKRKRDPYKVYLHSYNQNMIPIIQKKAEKLNPENSSTTSLNIIQEQSEKIPICAPTAIITQEQNNMPVVSTVSHQPGNIEIKDTTCTLIQSNDNNSEENRETIKNNNAPATSSSQQEHTAISEIAVTKKRKRKRKKTSESKTEGSTDVSIESKAEKVINQALEFKLPYMNQAVEEVKKQINDKNIKQEHIDVLQRLINLERDHQQYVSSFCEMYLY